MYEVEDAEKVLLESEEKRSRSMFEFTMMPRLFRSLKAWMACV